MFEDQAAVLRTSFGSTIKVTGGYYPLPAWRSTLASVISVFSWLALLYSFAGKQIIDAIGIAEPPLLKSAREGKLALLAVYLGFSFLGTKLSSSGAFEVTLDGTTLLWSKLEHGNAPSLALLFQKLERYGLVPLLQTNSH